MTSSSRWRVLVRSLVASAVLCTVGAFGVCEDAGAFQIKRIIRGSVTLADATEEIKTVDLTAQLGGTPLDTTKSFLVFTARIADNFNTRTDAYGLIDDASTLLFARTTATSNLIIEYMVVEFVSGVTVQSGLTVFTESQSGTPPTKNIAISTADTAKSFPLISWRSARQDNNAARDARNMFSAELTSSTNLRVQRYGNVANFNNDLAWQVVTFTDDTTVKSGSVDIDGAQDAGETSDSGTVMVATLSPALSSTAKAILFFNSRPTSDHGAESQYAVDGQITATNAVTFTRTSSTNAVQIKYQVLEFSNEVLVQNGRSTALGIGTASTTFNLGTALTLGRAMGVLSTSNGGAGNSDLDDTKVTGQLSTVAGPNTQVALTRGASATATSVSYHVAEFPPVNVEAPNSAGVIWRVGETQNITWKHADDVASNAANVRLSVNGGAYNAITCNEGARTMASDTCAWTIPETVSSTNVINANNKMQVEDNVLTARDFDNSNVAFEIKGKVTLTAPNGGQTWAVGTSQNITWTKAGDLSYSTYELHLSTDGGGAYGTTIATGLAQGTYCTGNNCSYSWAIPSAQTVGTNCKVRVRIAADTTGVMDESDAAFELRGSLTMTYPNGSETLQTQQSATITWNKTGSFNQVDLYYSKNSGGSYSLPNGDTIALAQATGASSGSYNWTVPTAAVSNFARVKVAQTGNAVVADESDADFAVVASITVTSPVGSETWLVGESKNITWTTNGGGLANVKIEYSVNGGGAYSLIVENDGTANDGIVTNNGTRAWDVPDAIAVNNVLVKISNPSISSINDVSDAVFTIKGQTQVSTPNGGQTWAIGAGLGVTSRIQWNNLGSFIDGASTVEIRYSTNGGSTYPAGNTIVAADPNSGASDFYDWSLPENIISGTENTTMRIQVTPSDVEAVGDTSDANFTIRAAVRLSSPNGGEAWTLTGGATQNISWLKSGDIATVNLKYSSNNGTSYPTTIVAGRVSTATPYTWTLPANIVSSQAKAKVEVVGAESTIFDESDATFTVKGTVTLLAPNGSETWYVSDTSRNITWDAVGTGGPMDGNVDIFYSTDGGANYNGTITTNSVLASAELFNWNPIPAASQSDTVKIKVQLTSDTTVNDVSNANLFIKPKLAVTAPNGGQTWVVAASQNITWTTGGTVSNVDLLYSTDGGGNYPGSPNIATNISNVGSYAWTVPDAIGTQLRVKVAKNPTDAAVVDESDANFAVRGSLTLTAPNGAETWIVGGSQNVTWTRTGSLTGNVKLYYSTDGGANYAGDPGSPFATVGVTTGSYSWTIPDIIGSTVRVKVVYENDANVFDASDANFTVKGSLTVTAPNGGEVWDLGTAQNITWTKTGTIGNVDLSLSLDGGTDGYATSIVTGVSSTSPYAWTIPTNTTLTTQARVKIAPVTAAQAAADTSDANFRLRGTFTLTAPNGGQTWIVGSAQNITWSSVGGMSNAKIEYTRDGGSTYHTVTASTPAGTGSYPWTIAWASSDNSQQVLNSSTVRIRISDAADVSVQDSSNADFTVKGSLTITAPNGGQTWGVGTSQNITWTRTGYLPNVKLEYSTDAGSSYPGGAQVITASTSGEAQTYAWTIPDAIGSQLRVKVFDLSAVAADPDESNANFSIKGSLTLTAPNGTEQFGIGSSQNITWTRTGTVTGNIKLVYSTDGGSTFPEPTNVITSTTAASALTYAWTVPDAPTTQARVRIIHTGTPQADGDDSNANFSIKGSLTVTAPNGAEDWKVGEGRSITWTKGGSIATVRLDLSTDGGSTYPTNIATGVTAANLSYAWTVNDVNTAQARVRVMDENDNTVVDASNANFTVKPTVTLTAPNGGQTWIVGSSQNITWTKAGTIANVKLEYSKDSGSTYPGGGQVIVASTPGADLSYAWTIPDDADSEVRVKISKSDDATIADESNADFAIKGSLTLTSPNGTEVWIVTEARDITWTRVGTTGSMAGKVDLTYSKDGGSSYPNNISLNTVNASALTYAWTVPDAIDNDLRVKVALTSDAAVTDASNANFTIRGALVLNAPNGSEAWTVQSSQNVTWTRTGTIANVKLDYSTNGGGSYANPIIGSTDGSTGSYAWTIPDAINSTVRVRVADAADAGNVFDDSNANFKIVGGLVLTAPNGSEIWVVNASQNITWTRTGTIANVRLDYSTDGGTSYPNVITASTGAAAQTYAWTIPNSPSATVRVRVADAADGTVNDASNANFKIRASLTLTAPDGGEVWTVGTGQSVTWTSVGTVNNVKLEYSTDGGSSYPFLVTASAPNTGTYSWTVPDAISTSVRVKVSDAADVDAFDASNGNFKIRGALALTAPNGGEQWGISQSRNVTWNRTGSIANVKLEYSTDAFVTELQTTVIIASTGAAVGTYAWTIPDAPGVLNKVRVSDASDPTVLDVSNNPFSIKGSVFMTYPNGGETLVVGSDVNVTWTKNGSISNVELRYSNNNGSTWPSGKIIVASTNASAGTYTWTIPDDISSQVLVRVSDANDSSTTDDSNAVCSIKGSLTVTSPNGSEVWTVGEARNITWTKTGSLTNAKIEMSVNGGSTYPTEIINPVSAAAGTYAWTVPDAIGTQVRVKITDLADTLVTDASNANFTIKGSLTLTAPNGAEVWTVGSSQAINWTRVGSIANVKLEYSTDGGVGYPNEIIASTGAAAGSYAWTVPDAISTTVKVKVTDVADASVNDVSNANFKIAGNLQLGAPNGGEAWLIASSENITWTRTGTIANVKLEYSTNSGSTYPNVITASTGAAAQTFAWTIPDVPTTAARVKVTSTADATVTDASNGDFSIRGSVTLTSPNGTEVWTVGESRSITWTKQGSINTVELRYSTNSGSSYPNVITASTSASALTYAWTVPDAISALVRVKITDTGDSAVTDTSNADFKIRGSIALTAPNGAEVWIVGGSQNITWTRVGSFANVKLDYSTDGGTGYSNAITASAPAAPLTYAWTVPDAIGIQLRVRAADAADPTVVFDTSDNNFTIKGSLTLNAPNGAETWIVGASNNITWAKTGTLGNAKLEYSTNSGSSYPNTIIDPVPAADLSYAWTVPDSISNAARVKITLLADTSVADASNADFNIKGSLTLTSPNGTETWLVGETRSITWTKTGSISTVRLDYSTNGGVSYPNVITASTGAGGLSFLWTVPDNMSSTVKVRIQDTTDATVLDESNANFKIAGSFTLTSPNGAEKWPAGSAQVITWTKTGSIANAKLEYSTDGGSTFPNLIVATTPASNLSYGWTLGSATSTQVRVKITDVSDATVNDVSNANFKIMGGFTLTAPNGGEVWVVGSSQNITWNTSGSVANVRLDYSVDGGTTFPNAISASATNTGSFGWTIPDAIGTTLQVKVEDVLDTDAKDVSDANFKIKGSVTVTAPNGGELWDVGSAQNITWTKTGTIANVKIEYSIDGGTNYPGGGQVIAAAHNASALTYAWTVPDQIYTTMRVRITDVGDATVFDQSNANFTIRGAFTVTAPNGAEKWKVGTTQAITWTTFGTIPNVRLEYSTDGGTSYPNTINASTANAGSFNWTVPNAISTTARVRVLNAADTGTLDASNANFKILANFVVTAPDGGEVLVTGSSYNATWTTQGSVSNVELKYSTNSGSSYPNTIAASTSNTGTFSWTVPDAISSTLRLRVADALDTVDAFDTSNADFKIRAGFAVTAPNGGEAWAVGAVQNVTWTTAGTVANVKLEYSTDGGSGYSNIVGSVANSGTYAWTIPDAITTAGRVRVSDVNDSTANDASNANFKIQGTLAITAPNGGESWTVATGRTITWNRTGSIPNVKLDFSTDGGSIYAPITASASNTGSYAWTIPDNVSTNCLVKITDTNDNTVTDVSDAAFKIQAGFVVTAPNGGEVWGVGSSRNITWSTNGTVSFVKLDYSSDGGSTYPGAITSSTGNTGAFNWTVPDVISGTMRVRVSQTTDATAFDTSDGNFRIRASLTLVAPNGAELWRVGQSRNVTWTVLGTIPTVRLQYSRDGFNVDIQSINAAAPQTGSYAWTIPDSISNTVRVRVSDPNDIGALDDSNADFRIIANFAVTAPNGGELWDVASARTITWTSAGSVPNVKLEYSTNSGGNWTAILGSTANDGTQGWTVPDAISPNALVRVSDPADATSFDDSDADFKIKAAFTLTAPNGSEIWTVGQVQNVTWTNTGTVPNVKLEYSTNGGAAYGNNIAASAGNTGTFAWTIPDAISTTMRVRVSSVTDSVDAFDASNADFKIRGAFTLTAPNGGEGWGISLSRTITWATTGTIATVKLSYSTNSGGAFPNVITASLANSNSYVWTVADAPTTTARVRVESTGDATVYDDSNADFSIQGNFTLTAPNGGEVWGVSESRNIAWSWGGTIPNVRLRYSTDGGGTYPNTIVAAAPNGAGSSGTYSYAWTVPDAISTTVRVRIEDANDANVFDTSDNNFKIQARFTVVAPNGGERWIVNESKAIQWTTGGTVPTVKLEYSTDGGSLYPNTIVASTANTGTYNWTVPNTTSAQARVRVVSTADATVMDASDANFTIDLYQITFQVKDLLSNNALDQITVNGTNNTTPAYTWATSGLTSPIVKGLQYGTWAVTFTRLSYGDQTVNVVVDSDQTVVVFMETQVVHIWEVMTDLTYNTTTDTVSITTTLRRDGSTVSGATSASVKFYDGSTLVKQFDNAGAPNAQGFYNFTWNNATTPPAADKLAAGKVYSVVSTGTIATGGVFNTPRTFSITEVKKLQDVQDTINSKLNVDLVTMQSNIRADLAAQTGAIDTALDDFETKSNTQINALKSGAESIKTTGEDLQKRTEDLEGTNLRFAGSLMLPDKVLIGDKDVLIRYRAIAGLQPLISITALDQNNKGVVVTSAVPMTANATNPDLYEYKIEKVTSPPYTPAKFVQVLVEATTFSYKLQQKTPEKNVEAGAFLVESTTLSTLEGLVAGQSGVKDIAANTLEAVRAVQQSFNAGSSGDVIGLLQSLNRKMDSLPRQIADQVTRSGDSVQMRNTINELAEQIRTLAGENMGQDFTDIIGKALDESSTMRDVRKKTDAVQGTTEVMQMIMEQKLGGVDDPVVHVIYQ